MSVWRSSDFSNPPRPRPCLDCEQEIGQPRASPRAPTTECGLPEIPSLEGYTIQELRIEQLARLMKLGELTPEQVSNLIRVLTGANSFG